MGLGGLHAAAADLQGELVVRDEVGVEGVARLVGHHVHIAGGAVEVGQDEGLLESGDLGAVAAAPLVFAGVHVKGVVCQHQVDEGGGFVAHLVIHIPGGPEDILLAAHGPGVAAGDDDAVIIEHIGADAQVFGVFRAQAGHHGDDGFQNVFAEGLHFLLAVGHPVHPVVAQLHEVFIAHALGHAVPDLHHPVIDVVQLGCHLVHGLAEDTVGVPAGLPVVILEEAGQGGAAVGLAPELELQPGHQLAVFRDQLVFLHHVLHDGGRHGHGLDLQIAEIDGRQGLFQLGAQGGPEQGAAVFGEQGLDLGPDLVEVLVLTHVVFVGGVAGVADLAQSGVGLVADHQLQHPVTDGQHFLHCFGGLDAVDDGPGFLPQLLQGQVLIGHIFHFHGDHPPFAF